MDPSSTRNPENDAADAAVIRLLRSADPRPAVPPGVLNRSRAATREAWRATVRRRRLQRAAWSGLAAAAVVALAAGVGFFSTLVERTVGSLERVTSPVAVLEAMTGIAALEPAAGRSSGSLATGAELAVGSEVSTDDQSRVAFRLAGGQSLRLDSGSRLRWLSDRVLELESGALYIDSRPLDGGESPEPIEIRTVHGSASNIGTQFEVRIEEDTLRVRVREGRVKIDQGQRSLEAEAGSEWTLHGGGRVSRRPLASYGEAWQRYQEIAPPFELEGSSLQAFLTWVARETGWLLVYGDPAIELSAPGIVLHGSLNGVPVDQAPAMVLETCGLSSRLADGVLFIDHRTAR